VRILRFAVVRSIIPVNHELVPIRAALRSVVRQATGDVQRCDRGGATVMLERAFETVVETRGCDKTPKRFTPHAAGSALPSRASI